MIHAFTILGTAKPQGSKRHVGRGIMVESCKALPAWRDTVRATATAYMEGRELFGRGEALSMTITVLLVRPKGHYRKDGTVSPKAPKHPATKPDLSKLRRAIEDSLSGVVFHDDAQIVWYSDLKVYCDDRPRVDITVKRFE
jgi:crossover junction endodeoxyribonuclease RusA